MGARFKTIPALFSAGIKDEVGGLEYARIMARKSFHTYHEQGAPWSLAIDPKADHGNRNLRTFVIPYLDAILSQRLSSSENNYRPQPVDTANAWLGHPETFEVAPAKGYSGLYKLLPL